MGEVVQLRDFKTREEREHAIHRLGLGIVSEALFPNEPVPDSSELAGVIESVEQRHQVDFDISGAPVELPADCG